MPVLKKTSTYDEGYHKNRVKVVHKLSDSNKENRGKSPKVWHRDEEEFMFGEKNSTSPDW